jgi:hypothetical protein
MQRKRQDIDYSYYGCVLLILFFVVAGTVGIIEASVKFMTPRKLPRTVILPELEFQKSPKLRTTGPPMKQHAAEEPPVLFLPELKTGPNYLGQGQFTKPRAVVDDDFLDSKDSEDYGEMQEMRLQFLHEDGVPRNIYQRSSDKKGKARALSDSRDDDYDNFFSFDDDA